SPIRTRADALVSGETCLGRQGRAVKAAAGEASRRARHRSGLFCQKPARAGNGFVLPKTQPPEIAFVLPKLSAAPDIALRPLRGDDAAPQQGICRMGVRWDAVLVAAALAGGTVLIEHSHRLDAGAPDEAVAAASACDSVIYITEDTGAPPETV